MVVNKLKARTHTMKPIEVIQYCLRLLRLAYQLIFLDIFQKPFQYSAGFFGIVAFYSSALFSLTLMFINFDKSQFSLVITVPTLLAVVQVPLLQSLPLIPYYSCIRFSVTHSLHVDQGPANSNWSHRIYCRRLCQKFHIDRLQVLCAVSAIRESHQIVYDNLLFDLCDIGIRTSVAFAYWLFAQWPIYAVHGPTFTGWKL